MIRYATYAALVLVQCVGGQPATADQFEVASVKPSNADPGSSGMRTGHGRLNANNVTLKRCIMGAYGVGPHQILGGPAWLDSDRFDIAAIASKPVDDDVLMPMLQHLLADRFQLRLHHETRSVAGYALEVIQNGPKLEQATGGQSSTHSSGNNKRASVDAQNTDMDLFAKVLGRQLDLPVVNHTGLAGSFHFKLQWTPDGASSAATADANNQELPSIFTAIQEQLGLRLRAQKVSVEIILVDNANKPSEN